MAVGVAAPEVADPAAAALVGGARGEAPLVAAGQEQPPPVDGVPAVEVEGDGEGSATLVNGAGGEAPLVAAGKKELPPADGVPAVEVEGKEVAAPLEGAPAGITVEGEEEAHNAAAASEKVVVEEEEEGDGQKWLGHYSSGQSILIVGDGDFSFSLALATAFGSGANLVATSLDTYEVLRVKYSKAESNINELKRLGAMVLHGVDAKKMRFHTDLKNSQFDRIVFNFPHAGFKGKEDDMHMINLHKALLWGFFSNARHLVHQYGEIHVTHKTGHPYDRWDLEHLAAVSSLAMVEKVAFQKEDYPGYNQKRGDSARCDGPFDLGACCTFKFQIRDLRKLKKIIRKRTGSIPSLGGSSIHPSHWAADRGPFHPLPSFMPDQRPQPGFPPSFKGIVRAPYLHKQESFHPMASMPGPWLNALPNPDGIHQHGSFHRVASMPGPWPNPLPPSGGIPPPMGRIPRPNLLAPQEQPWYQHRTVPDQLGRGNNLFLGGYGRSLPREGEMQGQLMLMPEATISNHSVFSEQHHRDRESVEKQEWLRWLIAFYGRP